MNRENQSLVTNEQVSLKNNRLKFKAIVLEEYMEYSHH